jgi:hypothetical protein
MGSGGSFSSPPRGGEGRAAVAAKGEGAVQLRTSPSPNPLPLKGARAFWVASQRDENGPQDAIDIGHHVGIGETDHAIPALLKGSRPSRVISFAATVGVTVELDDQPFTPAGEVDDEGREHHLPLKLHAQSLRAKMIPEAAFGFGEVRPQLLGPRPRFDVSLQTAPSPRSAALTRPLPRKGARGLDRHAFTPVHGSLSVNA